MENQIQMPKVNRCLICGKPVPDYIPEYCCNGQDCDCKGLPINPCLCSIRCEKALVDSIAKSFDERRKLAKIKHFQKEDDNELMVGYREKI